MTVLLTIVIVALLGITFWQMSKILKLSRSSKHPVDDSQVANNKDNKVQSYFVVGFTTFFYLLMIYCFWNYSSLYLPKSASKHGVSVDQLMFLSVGIIMFVQVITQFLLFYFSYKYKGEKGRKALFYADNDKLEFIWTIIPVIVLAGLIIYGLFTWSDIMNVQENEDTMVVELYAYQFGWKARYAGKDNTLGKADVRYIKGVNTVGVDETDRYAKDDKITSELHLPKGKKVLFKMRSQDVIHSAYFPFFRAQMNVLPGMITQFAFTPTMTTEEMKNTGYMKDKVQHINEIRREKSKALVAKGDSPLDQYSFDYFLLCNKVCGTGHYNMQMKVIVESQEDFDKWLAKQESFGETIKKQKESKQGNEAPSTEGMAATENDKKEISSNGSQAGEMMDASKEKEAKAGGKEKNEEQ